MSSPEPTQDEPTQHSAQLGGTPEGQVPSASPGYSTPPPEGVRDAEDQGDAAPE
ncbi:hypothetical protein [Mycobacterium sp. GA-2829]|uniref:hypothetical protein n=1 Tax=Mycobacterium sp. GA-2829 TaxID=1772283 RepID=UPI000A5D9444|nr:hypothetical protein [Mycobacterium sp. GA-2829]